MRSWIVLILSLLVASHQNGHATDPPSGYARAVNKPPHWYLDHGGPFTAARYKEHRNKFRFAHERVRGVYDAAGLPLLDFTTFRSPQSDLRWAPQLLRAELRQHGITASYPEKWTIHFNGELGVSWMAYGIVNEPKPPYDQAPIRLRSAWNGTPTVHFNGTGLDSSLLGEESLTIESWTKLGRARGRQGTRYFPVEGRVLRWDLTLARTGLVTPKPTLTDLKTLAPWFYQYLPEYVVERAGFFDHWSTRSVSVYAMGGANGRPHAHVVELSGSFSFENNRDEHTFEQYFDPAVFRRVHCVDTRESSAGNFQLTYPLRPRDVLVVEGAARGEYHVRFLAEPRYDPIKVHQSAGDIVEPPLSSYDMQQLQRDLAAQKRITVLVRTDAQSDARLRPRATYRVFAYERASNEVSLLDEHSNHHLRLPFDHLHEHVASWSAK